MEISKEQKKLRIRVAIFAYAYEALDESLVDDHTYDLLCKQVDTTISTDRDDLDKWFKENFNEYTGSWVHKHPEIKRIEEITRGIIDAKQSENKQT